MSACKVFCSPMHKAGEYGVLMGHFALRTFSFKAEMQDIAKERKCEDATAKRENAKVKVRGCAGEIAILLSLLRLCTLAFVLSPSTFYVCGTVYRLKIILAV